MNISRIFPNLSLAVLTTALCAIALAGCGSTNDAAAPAQGTTAPPNPNSSAAQLVPPDIRAAGSITIVTDATYPPYGFFASDGTTIQGLDADTVHAIESEMGLKINLVTATFDNFIPGLKAGRYVGGLNGISDTGERRKTVDFINFEKFGNYFLTPVDSNLHVTSIMSACGLTVGAQTGDESVTQFKELAPMCTEQGKPGPAVNVFPSQAAAISAMLSGRVQAILTGSNGPYLAEHSSGAYKINGPYLPNIDGKFGVGGLAIAKGSPLSPALLAAFRTLYANGTLEKIYATYGFTKDILIEPSLDNGDGPLPTADR